MSTGSLFHKKGAFTKKENLNAFTLDCLQNRDKLCDLVHVEKALLKAKYVLKRIQSKLWIIL